MQISEQWTNEERLWAIYQVSKEMHHAVEQSTYPWREGIFHWAERLRFLASFGPNFLEVNRESLFEAFAERLARLEEKECI